MLRLPRILHMEVHKVLRLPRILHMEVHKVLCLPRILRVEVHKVLRLPRILHVKKQVHCAYSNHNGGTDRRPPQTTAYNATARASNGAWRFTKCCACHEFCTWRFTKCCACHDFCAWRLITIEGRTGDDNRRQPPTTQQPEPLKHGGSQSAAPATKSAHGGSQSAAPATKSAHGGSQSAAPATKSIEICAWRVTKCCACHEICTWRITKCCAWHEMYTWRFTNLRMEVAPATNSAHPETSENSNHNGGTDRRPPQTCLLRSMEVHKVLRLPRILHMEVHKVLCLPRILHMEVHKVLRLPRILRVKKQVNTLIAMEGRTGDRRRQLQTTADNATARASNGAWRFTKCCACHEFCAWRFTKCCACHEFCASRNK